jgi:hypothetical protein
MTRLTVIAGSACLAAAALSGCSTATSQYSVSYQRYTYTCCEGADFQRPWSPGETLTLHWVAAPADTTADSSAQRITLTAVLTGPYPNVDALKAGGSPRVIVRATPVVTTDRAGANEVSSIVLPIDLADGFYNLADAIEGAGGKASSASVIHVSHIAGP